MLDEIEPHQFAEWFIAERRGYLDETSWDQAGTIAATLHNELRRINRFLDSKADVETYFLEDYIPGRERPKQEDNGIERAQEILRLKYGNHNR